MDPPGFNALIKPTPALPPARAPHGRPRFDSNILSLFSIFSPSPFSFSSEIKRRRPALPSSSHDAPRPSSAAARPRRPSSSAVRGGGRAFAAGVRDGRRAARHTAARGGGRGFAVPLARRGRREHRTARPCAHAAIRGSSRGPAAGVRAGRRAPRPAAGEGAPAFGASSASFLFPQPPKLGGLCFFPPPVAGHLLGPDPAAPSLDPAASLPDLVGALLSRIASRSPEPSSLPSAEPSALKH